MAGIKDTFTKGMVAINLKTSNMMEEGKLKTLISTQQQEIDKLKFTMGDLVAQNWESEDFSKEMFVQYMDKIKEKLVAIEDAKEQIKALSYQESQILGNSGPAVVYCTQCGAANKQGYKFCEKCGGKLETPGL